MNKLAIPAILVATVMVAGAFALMPVEQATAVHTTIGVQNVVSTANQDANASAVVLATSATIKSGDICLQFTETGADDNPSLDLSFDAANTNTATLVNNVDVETCTVFVGFGLNLSATTSEAADLLDYNITYKEVTP